MPRLSALVWTSILVDLAACTTCPGSLCKGGPPAALAAVLQGYPAAQTFCSSKHPVPGQTCTSIAPTTTVYSTIATSSSATIVETQTFAATAPTTTITSTISVTPTVTVTQSNTATAAETDYVITTVFQNANQKRNARGDIRASWLSSLRTKASVFVGSVCTCLETPASTIVTSTPTFVSMVTATEVDSETASTTAYVQIH